ncbi:MULTISPECIES: hypothetical protein [unclassified Sphingomonas]|nr:hypothetical protein [Sphingomonas sp. FARSPH]
MRTIVQLTLATLTMAVAATPAFAGQASPRLYAASYDARRDVYCLRLYADGQAADPRPNVSGTACQAKTAWAREGVFIADGRAPARVATR